MSCTKFMKPMGVALTALALLGGQLSPAYAAMVDSGSALRAAQMAYDRPGLASLFDRQDVRDQLVALGIDPATASERVAAMTDEEIRQLNHGLSEMPAGGEVLGFLLVIFVVLVITDMLGATDVFTFVHNINR
ncbi:MAG: DUF6627 family protein [Pseudomonadota bacterium]